MLTNSSHISIIPSFLGEGPAAYFWADTADTPTDSGKRLYDSAPNGTSTCGMMPLAAADGSTTYRIEFPQGMTINDFLGGCT